MRKILINSDRKVDDANILAWYYELLDLKEHAFVEIPERVQYYL